jgi:hypothetical protein
MKSIFRFCTLLLSLELVSSLMSRRPKLQVRALDFQTTIVYDFQGKIYIEMNLESSKRFSLRSREKT